MKLQVTSVIGVDPGQTTGIAFVDYINGQIAGKSLIQVDHQSAVILLEAMLARYYADSEVVVKRAAGVEAFITGKGAGTRGKPADVTRQLVFEISERLQQWGYRVTVRKAAEVKPKITDRVLAAADLLGPPEMRHAMDGARQALFTALSDLQMDNPLR